MKPEAPDAGALAVGDVRSLIHGRLASASELSARDERSAARDSRDHRTPEPWLLATSGALQPGTAEIAGWGRGGGHHGGGSERWLITYADMITLLMVFFVVMYSVSMVNVHKLIELSQSIQKSFRFKSLKTGTGMPSGPSTTESEDFQQVSKFVERTAKSAGVNSGITQTLNERGLTISLADSLFFTPGSTELKPPAKALIAKIVKGMVQYTNNNIRIEGHTDNTPYSGGPFKSNWELSVLRAAAVARHIESEGLVHPPSRISVTGYGEYRPIVSNNTPLNKARNRRVELVVLSSQFGDLEPNIIHVIEHHAVEEKPKSLVLTAQVRLEDLPLITAGEEGK